MNNRLEKLKEMLDKQPNDTFLLYAIAMEHIALGDSSKAKELLTLVLQLEQNNVAAYYQLGLIHANNGLNLQAIELFEECMRYAKLKGDLKTANECRAAIDELIYE